MAKRKGEKKNAAQQARPRNDKERQALYATMRRQFTAADLQKYTEIEPGIPLEDVIAEMEEVHRRVSQAKRKKG